jgi:hypothetical protein
MLKVDGLQDRPNPSCALGGGDLVFAKVISNRVDQHRLFPNPEIAGLVQHQSGLPSFRCTATKPVAGRVPASNISFFRRQIGLTP